MQNQASDTGSNLQEQQTGLQQNSPGLQPNATPNMSSEAANVLNNYRTTKELTVQDVGQPLSASDVQAGPNEPAVPFTVLALIIVPVAVLVAVFWPQKKTNTAVIATEIEPETVPLQSKPSKPKKKQSKRKRSAKR